jgi:hypothetical protein
MNKRRFSMEPENMTFLTINKEIRRRKMNFRRKLAMVIPVVVMAALAVALVAVPAGAVNQATTLGVSRVLNSPGPVLEMINYQGYLTDSGGNPINDTLEMTFSIYENESGGTAVWTETQPAVTVTDGLFNVLLGSINPITPDQLDEERYIGVRVGADDEMVPRQRLASVAFALRSVVANQASNADTLDGKDSSEFALSSHLHAEYVEVSGDTMTGQLVLPGDGLVAGTDQLVLYDGSVGIGTATPLGNYKLEVHGSVNNGIYASGNNYGIYGESSSGTGVLGINQSMGNYGRLGTDNDGVTGYSNADIGSGVYGHNTAAGYGVYGRNINSGNFGYLGGSDIAVYGYSGSGYGGVFTSDNDHFDLALGGAVGRINTDPENENSDLILSSNNDAVIRLDNDGGEEGVFRIKNSAGNDVCTITEESSVSIDQPYSKLQVSGHASLGGAVISGQATGMIPGESMSIGGGIGVEGTYFSDGVNGIGVYGEAITGMYGVGVYGKTDAPDGYGVYYEGGLAGTGTKSAIVQTQDYGWRKLYAVESPSNWFEDFGQGQLAGGQAILAIDPVFAQTVNLAEPYHVFVTPLSDVPILLFVTEKGTDSFTVRGVTMDGQPAEVAFDYRIVAKRLGYENLRLEPAEIPNVVEHSDWEETGNE